MVITMHYENAVEVFDTAERVGAPPGPGNVLTNWSLRLDEPRRGDALGGRRLWLDLYEHELPAGPGEEGPHGLPVARRRDVASFLLADEADAARLLRVSVGGETVLMRVAGELMDASRFSHAADAALVYGPQVAAVRRHLEAAIGDSVEGDPVREICAMLGLSPEACAKVELMQLRNGGD